MSGERAATAANHFLISISCSSGGRVAIQVGCWLPHSSTWKLNLKPLVLAKVYAWSSAVQRIGAVRVVPAALPHLPAFSGVTSSNHCVNEGRVSSLTLPSHLSLPYSGNCASASAVTSEVATTAAATTASVARRMTTPPATRVRYIASPPDSHDALSDKDDEFVARSNECRDWPRERCSTRVGPLQKRRHGCASDGWR